MNLSFFRRGSSGPEVQKLQQGLAAMTYHPGPIDRVYGPDTEKAVSVFQYARRVLADGVAGPVTITEYNDALREVMLRTGRKDLTSYRIAQRYNLQDPRAYNRKKRLKFRSLKIDGWPSDLMQDKRITVREDAMKDLKRLAKAVYDLGGVLTCERSGSKRRLSMRASQYRSRMSFHYLGWAFDLHPFSGMQDPMSDPFVVSWDPKDPARRWTVWGRSSKMLPHRTIRAWMVDRYKDRKDKAYTVMLPCEVSGPFYNFTEVAATCGFRGVPVRSSFLSGGRYTGADWWHFQWEGGLEYGRGTFGEELVKSYSLERIRRDFAYWDQVKNLRFGAEWF